VGRKDVKSLFYITFIPEHLKKSADFKIKPGKHAREDV